MRALKLERAVAPMLLIYDFQGTQLGRVMGNPGLEKLAEHLETALGKLERPNGNPDDGPAVDRPAGGKTPSIPADEMTIALRQARKFLRQKKTAEAVSVLAPHQDSDETSEAKSYVKELIAKLEEEGIRQVSAARRKLETSGQEIYGAMALVKARRIYGALPSLTGRFDHLWGLLQESDGVAELLAQAEAVDECRVLDEAGETEEAVKAYRGVLAKYPGTGAAEVVQRRLEQIGS
jgi:hypothetical protein